MSFPILHITSANSNSHADLIPKCLALFREGFGSTVPTFSESTLRTNLQSGVEHWYVLVDETEPITIAIYRIKSPPFGLDSVWSLCTTTSRRRQGHARKLLQHIRNTTTDTLFITADRPRLGEFYKSLGYFCMS